MARATISLNGAWRALAGVSRHQLPGLFSARTIVPRAPNGWHYFKAPFLSWMEPVVQPRITGYEPHYVTMMARSEPISGLLRYHATVLPRSK